MPVAGSVPDGFECRDLEISVLAGSGVLRFGFDV